MKSPADAKGQQRNAGDSAAYKVALILAISIWLPGIAALAYYFLTGGSLPPKNEGESVFFAFTVIAAFMLGALVAPVVFVGAIVGYLREKGDRASHDDHVWPWRFAIGLSACYSALAIWFWGGFG